MAKVLIILLLFFVIPLHIQAQILPKEGSSLNYIIIGFSFPKMPHASAYKIEIACGNYTSVDSFRKNIIVAASSKSNKIITEVPSFGKQYTWRVAYIGTKKTESALHHFATQMNDHVDTARLRLRIIQPARAYKGDYVSVDFGGVLYDMSGWPVWYVPNTNDITGNVADLQFTPWGTITFLCRNAYEINYNGAVLWIAPNNGIVSGNPHGEFYHHEFTRISNGHYMALGMQRLYFKPVSSQDSNSIIFSREPNDQNGYKNGKIGTIIEYDQQGNVVWSWESSKYLKESDFNYFNPIDTIQRFDPHDNAFYFDEKNKCIYLGFRNLDRIIKIEYPSGKVLRTYGEIFKPGVQNAGEGLLCNQHSIGRTQDGYLYIFNNNSCRKTDALPSIIILQEPVLKTDTLKIIWEYTCTVEDDAPKRFGSGGNAIELPGRSMFVNMGSEYSKLFIVNREKKVLWSAIAEEYAPSNRINWRPIHEYRANIISRKDLERLIWNAEIKK